MSEHEDDDETVKEAAASKVVKETTAIEEEEGRCNSKASLIRCGKIVIIYTHISAL